MLIEKQNWFSAHLSRRAFYAASLDRRWFKVENEHWTNHKKAAKRLYLLKVLKNYVAPKKDLLTFYCAVIRSTVEYAAQVWHGGLTQAQSNYIERIQKRALRIIDRFKGYEQALTEAKINH